MKEIIFCDNVIFGNKSLLFYVPGTQENGSHRQSVFPCGWSVSSHSPVFSESLLISRHSWHLVPWVYIPLSITHSLFGRCSVWFRVMAAAHAGSWVLVCGIFVFLVSAWSLYPEVDEFKFDFCLVNSLHMIVAVSRGLHFRFCLLPWNS